MVPVLGAGLTPLALAAPCSGSVGCYKGSHDGSRELMGVRETTAMGKSRASRGLSTLQEVQGPSAHQHKPAGPEPMRLMAIASPRCSAPSELEPSSTHSSWRRVPCSETAPSPGSIPTQAQDQY